MMYLYLISSVIVIGIAIYLFNRGNSYKNDSYYQQFEFYHNHYLSKDGRDMRYDPINIRRFYYTYFFYNYISVFLTAIGLFSLGTFAGFFSNAFCNIVTALFKGLAEGFIPFLMLPRIIMHQSIIPFTVVHLKIITIVGLLLGVGILVLFIIWLIKILKFWYENKQKNSYFNNCDLDQQANNDIKVYEKKKEILLYEFNEKSEGLNHKLEIYQQKIKKSKVPEELLRELKLNQKEEKIPRSGFDKFINAVTGGSIDKSEAEKEYKKVKKVWDAYNLPLLISQTKAELLKLEYKYYRELALQLSERIKTIVENANIKHREFNESNIAISELRFIGLSLSDVNNLELINRNKKSEFANKVRNTFAKYSKEPLNKLDVASLAFSAIDTWITNARINATATEKFTKKASYMKANFKTLETERLNMDIIVARETELISSLKKSIKAFDELFSKIYKELYPNDDIVKSRKARKKNVENGGTYFNEEEKIKIRQLCIVLKYLLQIVDSKI